MDSITKAFFENARQVEVLSLAKSLRKLSKSSIPLTPEQMELLVDAVIGSPLEAPIRAFVIATDERFGN